MKQLEAQKPSSHTKATTDMASLGLIINFKHCIVEDRPQKMKNELANMKPLPKTKCLKSTSSGSIKKLTEHTIEVEGKNLNSFLVADERSHSLAMANNFLFLSQVPEETSKSLIVRKNLRPLLTAQLEKTKATSMNMQTKMPLIEVKGSQFNQKQVDMSLNNSALSNYSTRNQFLKAAKTSKAQLGNAQSAASLITDGLFLKRNTSLNDKFRHLDLIQNTLSPNRTVMKAKTSDFDKETYDETESNEFDNQDQANACQNNQNADNNFGLFGSENLRFINDVDHVAAGVEVEEGLMHNDFDCKPNNLQLDLNEAKISDNNIVSHRGKTDFNSNSPAHNHVNDWAQNLPLVNGIQPIFVNTNVTNTN